MFEHASACLRLFISVALMSWLLIFFLHTASGFSIRDFAEIQSSGHREKRDMVQCATDPASLQTRRRMGIKLTKRQTYQIRKHNVVAKGDMSDQPTLVELTEGQQAEVIAIYGSYFREKESIAITKEHSRMARNTIDALVCESVSSYDTFILAKNTDGKFVQVVQLPDKNLQQYILQESCLYPLSRFVNGVSCSEKERDVFALIVEPETNLITEGTIVVGCCAAYQTL
ncbi:uncharacterized protein [Antedon mediterranea]|uniref:uncharacterized protein n=1 Tax=Antedon mediterranea TaxID=105859 RepID=UPI003AF719C6